MTKTKLPSPKTQFQFAIKKAEVAGWGFFGWEKDEKFKNEPCQHYKWRIGTLRGNRLCLTICSYFHYDLATVLNDLDFRKRLFGEGSIIDDQDKKGMKEFIIKEMFIGKVQTKLQYYSQQMFSQGESVQMLGWLYKFLKGKER